MSRLENARQAVRNKWGSRLCLGIGEATSRKCYQQGGPFVCACQETARAAIEAYKATLPGEPQFLSLCDRYAAVMSEAMQ